MEIINSANQDQWLAAHAHWEDHEFYPNRLSYQLVKVVHYLEDFGSDTNYVLELEVQDDLAQHVRLTGPAGMFAQVGVELSSALAAAGIELMCHEWHMEFHWPAQQGLVLELICD